MAKKSSGEPTRTTRANLLSPLYSPNTKTNLGGEPVGGVTSGKATPDPLKFAPFDLQASSKGKAQKLAARGQHMGNQRRMAIPGGLMPGGQPPMGGMPPMPPGPPEAEAAYSALNNLVPKSKNPTESIGRIDEALSLMHRLVMAVLPQISQQNPKVAKDLHAIGQRILSAKSELKREAPLAPPPDLMLGMGGGGTSAPSLGSPLPGGPAGGGALPY